MKHLYDPAAAAEVKARIASLRPDSPRQWGKMSVAQMLAHCIVSMEGAVGDRRPKRLLFGRLMGGLVKNKAIHGPDPLPRNSPTDPTFVIVDERDLEQERARLLALVDRFAAGGAQKCTTHPHSFFGRLTPEEWAILMYKHLDHHLRQFGV